MHPCGIGMVQGDERLREKEAREKAARPPPEPERLPPGLGIAGASAMAAGGADAEARVKRQCIDAGASTVAE